MTKEQRELYDYFEHFWDDLKKKPPKKPKERDAGKEMANFLRELDFSFHPLKSKEEKQKNYIRGSGSAKSQNCILKMHYVQDKNKHLAFLTEYMTQLDKKDIDEKPVLFSDVEVDKTFFDSYQKIMTDLHFRFIISPESQDVDLRVVVKVFIEKLNSLYGYQLNWVGCIHENTNHRHAHVLINGVDKNGRSVRFPKSFVKETGRMMVQNICTGLVGFRTSKEILQKKGQEPFLERFTSIDEDLLSIEQKLGVQNEHFSTFVLTRTEKQNERCEKLVELGLAKKLQSKENCFWLENNWNEKLRILGKVNVYKKARANMKLVHPGKLELWDDTKPEMDGIVTQLLYKNDEENWINAVVVENARLQKAYLIPFPGEMPDYRVYTQFVHCGKYISKKGRTYPKLQVYREANR